jgi:hypothetical protein
VPDNLKRTIEKIQMNGGKSKLAMDISIIKKNAQSCGKSFQHQRALLQ